MGQLGRTETLARLVTSLLENEGYELVELKLLTSGRRLCVRVLIDHATGSEAVTVGDCAKVSKLLGADVDLSDRLPERHVLEVSSPGMDRPLTLPRHYRRFLGERAVIRLLRAREGKRRLDGIIVDADERQAVLEDEGGSQIAITFDEIESAHLKVDPWKPRERHSTQT